MHLKFNMGALVFALAPRYPICVPTLAVFGLAAVAKRLLLGDFAEIRFMQTLMLGLSQLFRIGE
jgi:hypothetical protein